MSTSTLHLGIFYMPQICDMGPTALHPLRRKACWGFFRPLKIRRLRPGLNPRTWVLKASTLPLDHHCLGAPNNLIRPWSEDRNKKRQQVVHLCRYYSVSSIAQFYFLKLRISVHVWLFRTLKSVVVSYLQSGPFLRRIKKCTAKPTEGESKIYYEYRPSVARFTRYSLLKKKDLRSVYFACPCRHCRTQTSGTHLSPTKSDWGCLPRFPMYRPSTAVARWECADWKSLTVHTCWRSTHFLLAVREFLDNLFLKQWIARSGQTEHPAPFPDVNPWVVLSLWTSAVCCLRYRSQWVPELAKTNTEWIWDDLYDTWKFSARQAVTFQRVTSHWCSKWTAVAFSFVLRRL